MSYGDERLGFLIEDLAFRVRRAPEPYLAYAEMGRFVEELNDTIADILKFEKRHRDDKLTVNEWHVLFAKRGIEVHPYFYNDLFTLFQWRNISDHPNADALRISWEDAESSLATIGRRLADLERDLVEFGFVDALVATQASSRSQRLAHFLSKLLGSVDDHGSALVSASDFAATLIPEKERRYLYVPEAYRLPRVVSAVANRAGDGTVLLEQLARHVIATVNSEAVHESIRKWFLEVARLEPAVALTETRFNVIRVSIASEPDSRGFVIADVQIIEPPIPFIRSTSNLPIPFEKPEELFSRLGPVVKDIKTSLARLRGHEADLRSFVLQLEIDPENCCLAFEMSRNTSSRLLSDYFRCVTVRPLVVDRYGGHLGEPVSRPGADPRFVAVWEPLTLERLVQMIGNAHCYFAGPALWSGPHGCDVAPAVAAFDEAVGALGHADEDKDAALDKIFEGHSSRPWDEILDRVTALRREGERIVVLWDDRDYDIPLAESL